MSIKIINITIKRDRELEKERITDTDLIAKCWEMRNSNFDIKLRVERGEYEE